MEKVREHDIFCKEDAMKRFNKKMEIRKTFFIEESKKNRQAQKEEFKTALIIVLCVGLIVSLTIIKICGL